MVKQTHKTICREKPTNCLNVFDHFVGLTLKGLRKIVKTVQLFFGEKYSNFDVYMKS